MPYLFSDTLKMCSTYSFCSEFPLFNFELNMFESFTTHSLSLSLCSVQKNGRLNSGSGERNGSPWPPWRLPTPCDDKYADPRLLLHSRYAHGLIFNLLYKAVYQEVSSDNITSLTLFLLELALSLPQTDFSGKVSFFSNFVSALQAVGIW